MQARSRLTLLSTATFLCCCVLAIIHFKSLQIERSALLQRAGARHAQAGRRTGHHLRTRKSVLHVHEPKSVFDVLKTAMQKDLHLKAPQKAVWQMKAATDDAEDQQFIAGNSSTGKDVAAEPEPPRSTVYIYAGREVKPHSTELTAYILESGFGIEKIGYINSASDSDIRSAVWDDDCKAIIFPALKDIPDFGANAAKDLKAFVARGMSQSGTVLFLGSPVEVHLINELFGFEIQQDYKEGPYYKNGRYSKRSAWAKLPPRVREMGQTESLGFLMSSLPPETRSYYDSFGDSVAGCARYDLGRVCYLAQDFSLLSQLPALLKDQASGDASKATDATQNIQSLQRSTDSWLAIFKAILEDPVATE